MKFRTLIRIFILVFALSLLTQCVYAVQVIQRPLPCLGCHSNLTDNNYLHPDRYQNSVHGHLPCLGCHSPSHVASIDSVHQDSVAASTESPPTPPEPLERKSPFADTLAACGRCHQDVFTTVRQSIHGQAVFKKGITDAAFCTDCHTPIHFIKPVSEVSSSVARSNLINTCSRCHANRIIASQYGLNIYVVQSYKAHFHGKKYSLGGQNTPTCVVCHGHHAIREINAPDSLVSPQNKVSLCEKCHEGATPEFAESFTHTPLNAKSNPVAFRIRKVMVSVLSVILILLSLHLILDVASQFRSIKHKNIRHTRKDIPWSLYQRLPRKLERMDLHLRIQHALLLVAIFYLAASGFALKYPEIRFSQAWIGLWGGVENAGHLHRFAALLLIIDSLYHLLYIVIQRFRRKISFKMLPNIDDATHLFQNIRYLTGIRKEKPLFFTFTYIQKLNYWVVASVVLIMIISGLMYWFPTVTARILPSQVTTWIWGVAYVIHSTEAFLILFFAFVWHFYNVHLKSRVFPMSWVWITGKIDLEDLMEDHPGEFKRLLESEKEKMQKQAEQE